MKEKLIGFDVRVMWLPVDALWDSERKSVYLLRGDTTHILSTDTGVWPSIFDDSVWGANKSEIKIDGPGLPDAMISSVYPFWLNCEQLKIFLEENAASVRKPYWLVGISCFIEALHSGNYEDTNPIRVSEDWEFLGFDISDGAYISALSNCGYTEADDIEKRQFWEEHINTYHLFDSFEIAHEFKLFSNHRIKEHAPFAVYGLYLITNNEEA